MIPSSGTAKLLWKSFEDNELGADGDQLSRRRPILPLVLVEQLDLDVLGGLEAGSFGRNVFRGVATVELYYLAGAGADDIDDLLLGPCVDGQGAEGGGRHLLGDAPTVAERHIPLAHEEPQAVLEHGDRLRLRRPDMWIYVARHRRAGPRCMVLRRGGRRGPLPPRLP